MDLSTIASRGLASRLCGTSPAAMTAARSDRDWSFLFRCLLNLLKRLIKLALVVQAFANHDVVADRIDPAPLNRSQAASCCVAKTVPRSVESPVVQ